MQIPMEAYEFLQNSNKVTDFTTNGECSNCGSCCSNRLPMTKQEIKTIKLYVKRNKIQPRVRRKTIFDQGPVYDMTCPFFVRGKGCTIYPVRPDICKFFICNKPNVEVVEKLLENPKMYSRLESTFIRETIFPEG